MKIIKIIIAVLLLLLSTGIITCFLYAIFHIE